MPHADLTNALLSTFSCPEVDPTEGDYTEFMDARYVVRWGRAVMRNTVRTAYVACVKPHSTSWRHGTYRSATESCLSGKQPHVSSTTCHDPTPRVPYNQHSSMLATMDARYVP